MGKEVYKKLHLTHINVATTHSGQSKTKLKSLSRRTDLFNLFKRERLFLIVYYSHSTHFLLIKVVFSSNSYFYCSYFEFLLVVIWFEKVFVLKVESAILLYNHNILMIFSCKSSFMLRNSIQSFIQ